MTPEGPSQQEATTVALSKSLTPPRNTTGCRGTRCAPVTSGRLNQLLTMTVPGAGLRLRVREKELIDHVVLADVIPLAWAEISPGQ